MIAIPWQCKFSPYVDTTTISAAKCRAKFKTLSCTRKVFTVNDFGLSLRSGFVLLYKLALAYNKNLRVKNINLRKDVAKFTIKKLIILKARIPGREKSGKNENTQGDQIGRNFAIWAIFYGVGRFFNRKNSPMICAKF